MSCREHKATAAKARKITGWIKRALTTREVILMMVLFILIVRLYLEYCSVLTAPFKTRVVSKLENILRSFTDRIESVKHLNQEECFSVIGMYSLEQSRERYLITFTWMILGVQVENLYILQ